MQHQRNCKKLKVIHINVGCPIAAEWSDLNGEQITLVPERSPEELHLTALGTRTPSGLLKQQSFSQYECEIFIPDTPTGWSICITEKKHGETQIPMNTDDDELIIQKKYLKYKKHL